MIRRVCPRCSKEMGEYETHYDVLGKCFIIKDPSDLFSSFSASGTASASTSAESSSLSMQDIEDSWKRVKEVLKELGPPLAKILLTLKVPAGAYEVEFEEKIYILVNKVTWASWEPDLKKENDANPSPFGFTPLPFYFRGTPVVEDEKLVNKILAHLAEKSFSWKLLHYYPRDENNPLGHFASN